ncbi:glutamine--fructose-6-phosphate aminotransferase [candidate division WOR-1 bacterium RIFOXYA12_FULL_52_29]|uniref:Glutamine--fructose-6-phosphate aminotransferase [isomerizing] n=1 Tax=candidate division WOR-1 bacterium RIFOXYC12_FULL_54_18 TaxID=1802584 RepID=A0A1F4T6X1_UNCSA|nr:MAG: glutamine--fructose-6-phosphate aminotransferase [candidate division WOR-1 bacterium RIFOXYA2_FULL_51_19]OGC18104.1 MAG: glutamine--fructose-6-phosphate aminotransferase [candidate division WOR-1 bacterium RIFOXYA12_FULL_52_29]OGC26960.1 MAG: glutamine--fructose-6-phosphate aminotransferase [candidate division WOR-1 bacterium RIFOXYB2_FULL_45_9]OGC28521.1 MAG: glutamine--fructose-6-phosphate aminotransferase [candidate division WOR-1 bacterium RIFOXYC12_FULL_54_18]OGC31024.1 MAG: glutam
MCGIFGYIGRKEALPFLIEGLKKLEYRGYDSAGVATIKGGKIQLSKCVGKISFLEDKLAQKPLTGKIGIGHTRWATHGQPSDENSHPHQDCKSELAVVHNGIIENYQELKIQLSGRGHRFLSSTDTEVLAHLIEENYQGDLLSAVRKTIETVRGTYAMAVISKSDPKKIVVARSGSPLIIGLGENELFLSSDIPAMLKYTSRVIYLENGELAVMTPGGVKVFDLKGKEIAKEIDLISWDPESAEKGGYAHFMLKEIHEQPNAIRKTIAGRIQPDSHKIHFDELTMTKEEMRTINRVVFTACGTSWHAGLIGEYLFEQFARLPTEVEYAAEFRYRHPIIDKNTLVIAITQSGETADTLGAVWEARAQGAKTIAICNVVGSTIARESDGVIYTNAGPEIGVASTKAFTTQLTVIYLLALLFGKVREIISESEATKLIQDLIEIPDKLEKVLLGEEGIAKIAGKFYQATNSLYLGRGKGFPIALEGALKLKEVSYIHAEGYPAAEMKHGPIALIDKNMPVVILAFAGRRYEKVLGNIEEVKARGGQVIAIATEGDDAIARQADEVLYIPNTTEALSPLLAAVPLQIFAYYIALKRGCHVDQPRNLAKSVTVE